MFPEGLKRQDVPCCYELSYDAENFLIIIRVKVEFFDKVDCLPLTLEMPIVAHAQEQFRFDFFCGDLNKDFGFNSCLKRIGEKDGFIEYSVQVPIVREVEDGVCETCEGTGKHLHDESSECYKCEGTGSNYVVKLAKRGNCISATLSLLFSILNMELGEFEYSDWLPQLFEVDTFLSTPARDGAGIGGVYSRFLIRHFRKVHESCDFSDIVKKMLSAYTRMWQRNNDSSLKYTFRVEIVDYRGVFQIFVPGNACYIFSSSVSGEIDEGFDFAGHNVDTVDQQLMILIALACMHDRVKAELR
jgi:hypothetical protein